MLCLFDLDGTLIDSEHGIVACVKHALAKLDVPAPSQQELRDWIGPPLRHSFRSEEHTSELQSRP